MASDDIVRLKGDLWKSSPVKFKKHIQTFIQEFKKFNPNQFLSINYHLVVGTQIHAHKLNLCQVVDAMDLCRKCELAGDIDCTLGINKKGERSVSERILELIDEQVELFTSLDETYARVSVGGHFEIHPINGTKFKEYLSYLIYQEEQRPPGAEAVATAKNLLSAKARFEGKEYTLHNRVAWHKGDLYYDLSNRANQVVRITDKDWEIEDSTEIPLFKRYGHQEASPLPVHVKNPEKVVHRVLDFVNHDKKDEGMKILILVSLITSFIPDIPHCVIILYGDQGSAKTTFMKLFRKLIDPSDTDTMSFPRSKDLNQVLDHNWFCGFDNVGGLKKWLSDALCRAVTGDGNVTRQHYTNDDDFIRKYRRVVALNGINNVATQPDLLDRSVLFKLPRITGKNRLIEKDLLESFAKKHPEILGAIFSILSKAYKIYPTIDMTSFFRLADWTVWGCAITQALGYDPNLFTEAYAKNKVEITGEAISNDDVATTLLEFIYHHPQHFWSGKMSELLTELEKTAATLNISTTGQYWPKAGNSLSRKLNLFATPLREAGIRYEMVNKEKRIYEVEYIGGVADVPKVPRGLEQFLDTSDDNITVSEHDTVSEKSTEKTGESTSDDSYGPDDILQNHGVSIPLFVKEGESRGVQEYQSRWQRFLERTSDYHLSYTFEIDELEKFYSENERGQLQRDLEDWEKDGLVFRKKTKTKEGWRVTDRGSPPTEESKK
ncbi:MAG: hypothetical protein ACTSSE_18840 [Candidatus Thorarchaeota archaeon]